MKRLAALAVVTVLLISLAALPTTAQSGAVELRLGLKQGEAAFYQLTRTVQHTMEIAGERRGGSDVRIEAREAHRALQVGPDGTVLMEIVFEDLKCTCGGRTEEPLDTPLVLRVRPDGRVVEVVSGEERPPAFPLLLPDHPITIGESWTLQLGEGNIKATITYTLAGVEQIGDERVAVIRTRVDGRATPDLGPLPPGMSVRSAQTVLRGSGEVRWSVDRGRLARSAGDWVVETVVDVETSDQSVQMRATTRGAERREPLSMQNVIIPAAAPEWLITPARGVGTITLDTPVTELNAKFGTPADRGRREGFKAAGVLWADNLFGFIDPGEPDRVLGLEVAGRRNRTEKGIGFGSSEGAVLLAYGLSPMRLEMSLPGLGAMRFLIYDDQGIAFAINLDKAHASRGPTHAPVGAVDWVIVFRPGDAGKIFNLP